MINRFTQLKKKYYYDREKAEKARDFIYSLCHVEGEWAGNPFELYAFQWDDIIKPVFGLYESKGGNRLINECYIEIPKKNGKTTLLAAIELLLLFADGEPGAQIYNCAGDDTQAELLFRTAKNMVLADKELKANSIQHRADIHFKNRFIKKLTSKADTKHGLNAHGVIYDELHAAQDADLYETLKYAGAQRRSPIFFQITTAGHDKTSICYDRHTYTEKLLKGTIHDDHFWGVIYAAKDSADPFNPKVWAKANPMYQYSETFRKNFEIAANEARNNIAGLNAFKRLRLNIWTKSETKWLSDLDWAKGSGKMPDLTGMDCYAGLDLASVSDSTSLILLFKEDDVFYVIPFIFVPERAIRERDKRNEFIYSKWDQEGFLIRTPGDTTDYGIIRRKINDLKETYNIKSIGYDRFNSSYLLSQLDEEDGLVISPTGQGFVSMSEPTKNIQQLVMTGKLIHGGHPVLSWQVDNVMIVSDDADNIKISKKKSVDKVDAAVSLVMAYNEWNHWEKEGDTEMLMMAI